MCVSFMLGKLKVSFINLKMEAKQILLKRIMILVYPTPGMQVTSTVACGIHTSYVHENARLLVILNSLGLFGLQK